MGLGGSYGFGLCFGLGCSVGRCFVFRVSGCVMDYCVGFGRCFGFCFVLWGLVLCWEVLRVLDCIWDFGVGFGRCFVFGIVLWIIVFVLGGALCIAGLVLGGSVFCNFCCIDFWIRETLPNYFTGIFWEILFSMRETLPPKLYDGFWWCSIGWILLGWLVHVIFFGMDYSTILLVGLLNNFCDGVLLWFMMIGRCCGFVFVLVDWLFFWFGLCLGCYDLFVWCFYDIVMIFCWMMFLKYGFMRLLWNDG